MSENVLAFSERSLTLSFLSMTLMVLLCCGSCTPDEPRRDPPKPKTDIKIDKVNVYVENSGSMDAYVNGETEFKNTVFDFLSTVENIDILSYDSMNLYYINKDTIRFSSNSRDVLLDFVKRLEPTRFKERGGARGRSDFSDIFKSMLDIAGPNDVSILVTDGAFSMGSDKDATDYLPGQETGIKRIVSEFMKRNSNSSIVVYKLTSACTGKFFGRTDSLKSQLNKEQRPYYIFMIGKSDAVAGIFKNVTLPSEKVYTATLNSNKISYKIKPKSGSFNLSRNNPQSEIENLENNHYGDVKFAVYVDFSNVLIDDDYVTDINNYELSMKNYSLVKIEPVEYNECGFTHLLYFESDKVKNGELRISLKKQGSPDWDADNDDLGGAKPQEGKTFGIKYIIQGIHKGFYLNDKSKNMAELVINIKK